MIAIVKIAPIERSCDSYANVGLVARKSTMKFRLLMKSIAIDPPSALTIGHRAGARWWRVAPEFGARYKPSTRDTKLGFVGTYWRPVIPGESPSLWFGSWMLLAGWLSGLFCRTFCRCMGGTAGQLAPEV